MTSTISARPTRVRARPGHHPRRPDVRPEQRGPAPMHHGTALASVGAGPARGAGGGGLRRHARPVRPGGGRGRHPLGRARGHLPGHRADVPVISLPASRVPARTPNISIGRNHSERTVKITAQIGGSGVHVEAIAITGRERSTEEAPGGRGVQSDMSGRGRAGGRWRRDRTSAGGLDWAAAGICGLAGERQARPGSRWPARRQRLARAAWVRISACRRCTAGSAGRAGGGTGRAERLPPGRSGQRGARPARARRPGAGGAGPGR